MIRGFAVLAIASAAAATLASSGGAITGGTLIQIASSPSTVYVEYGIGDNSYYRCTGSILDPSHVVTAAHCLYDLDGPKTLAQASQLMVDAGLSNFFTPTAADSAQSVRVSSFRIHPGFSLGPSEDVDDVAVLTLATPIDLSRPGVGAVKLPAAKMPLTGGTAITVAGFGRQNASASSSGPLASLTGATYRQRACGEFTTDAPIANDDAVVSCFISPRSAVCNGDSGAGVLTTGGVLVGVVVAGDDGCLTGTPAIFTNVTAPEILSFIQGNDSPPVAPRATRATFYRLTWPKPLAVGAMLTCWSGGWSSPVQVSYEFLDVKTKAVLQSGSRRTYRIPSKALGRTIRCDVFATSAGGTALESTGATPKIQAAGAVAKKR